MAKNVFTKSDNFKSEYSCAVVRIDDLVPVEGSDFLAKTLVMGTQIVVRRDQLSEGSLVLYAANETQLNEKFLSVNNLYEVGCREKNANREEVDAIMRPYLDKKPEIDKLRSDAKNIKGIIEGCNKKAARLNKTIKKLQKELDSLENASQEERHLREQDIKDKREKADAAYKKALEMTTKYTKVKQEIESMVKEGEPIVAEAKKKCGFFNKYGRVRCITLRNEPSFGYLFSLEELQRLYPDVTMADLEAYEGEEFDTINGELFVKAYVPPVKPQRERRSSTSKAQKKVERFDRMVEGEFYYHYDTTQLAKAIHRFKPTDVVTISNKIHGTSAIFGKLKVRYPKKIALYKKIVNKICQWLHKPKHYIDYYIDYGNLCSSRTVIKNRYINKGVTGGFYGTDIWSVWGERVYKYLDNGMTIYGEIFGYLPNEEGADAKYIQKFYDYGCEKGQSKLMIYRITTSLEDGSKYEWEVRDIYEFTLRLIERMKAEGDPTAELIHPIDIFYHGQLGELYADLDPEDEKWHDKLLERMKNDKRFGMEEDEPMCTANIVPREGIVLRLYGDTLKESFKLKCSSFLLKEAIAYDSDNYVDIEVAEGDYQTDEDVSESEA